MPTDEEYLGDAVYASFDGYHVWLRTGDGNNQRIALEPSVFTALINYRANLIKRIQDARNISANDVVDSGV